MKLRIISDLHCEFWSYNKRIEVSVFEEVIPCYEEDNDTILVIAGDLGLLHRPESWLRVLKYLAARFKSVVAICGNHEFYHNNYFGRMDMFLKEVKLPRNVRVLDNAILEIEDVVFIGGTLWTDLNKWDEWTMNIARKSMNDYSCIRNGMDIKMQPSDTILAFEETKKFIFSEILKYNVKSDKPWKTVVLTHHLPSYACVSDRFKGDLLNPAFATELGTEIAYSGPDIWIFGHTHDSHDSTIGNTRMLCNPYGYRGQEVNPRFNKNMILEV